jgi:hypothetical protein
MIIAMLSAIGWYYLLWFILSTLDAPTFIWCVYAAYAPVAFAGSMLITVAAALPEED